MAYGSFAPGGAGGAYSAPAPDPNAYGWAMRDQRRAYMSSPEYEREQFERGLQSQEQQRRQYDSETARHSQQQKYGVLGGLIGKMGSNYGAPVNVSRITYGG